MLNTVDDTVSSMVRFVETVMTAFSRQLENNVGMPLCRIDYDDLDNKVISVKIGLVYAGPGQITEKAKKSLCAKLEKRFHEQFGLIPTLEYLEVEGPQYEIPPMLEKIRIPAKVKPSYLEAGLLMASTIDDEATRGDISSIIKTIRLARGEIQQRTLVNFFLTLMWPRYEEALRSYSHLSFLGPCSAATAVSYYVHTQVDAKLVTSQINGLARLIAIDHPDWFEFSNESHKFNIYLGARSDANFMNELSSLKKALEQMSRRLERDLSQLQEIFNHVLLAGDIMRKMRKLTDFMLSNDIYEEFSTLIAPFWTVTLNSPIDKFSTFDYENFCSQLRPILRDRRTVRDFLQFAEQAPALIDARIADIESSLNLEKRQRLDNKKARKKALRQLAQNVPAQESTVEPSSAAQIPVVTHSTATPATRESKEHARLIAARQETKQTARQLRRLTLFDPEAAAPILPLVTTIKFVDMHEGITQSIDICPSALGRADADYYQILPNKFILANRNPCLTLGPAMHRLLHSNQGRGFIGEVSHGQTGLKYFKEGKDEFVVLKAADEERVLCAIKTLHSDILDRDIDLIIPCLSIKNHEDYRKVLERKHIGAWLCRLVDDRVLIEESFELQEADAAAVRMP